MQWLSAPLTKNIAMYYKLSAHGALNQYILATLLLFQNTFVFFESLTFTLLFNLYRHKSIKELMPENI